MRKHENIRKHNWDLCTEAPKSTAMKKFCLRCRQLSFGNKLAELFKHDQHRFHHDRCNLTTHDGKSEKLH
eukprot:5945995-Amphidinium_carterae.1